MKNIVNFNLVIVLALIFILSPAISFSQTKSSNNSFQKYYSINLNVGPTLFWGDLREYDYYPVMNNKNEWRVGYGMIINWQISPVFGLRGQILNGKLSGTSREIDRYFMADILTGNINTTVNFSNLFFKYNPKRFFSVYGLAGVGLSNWRTEMKDLQTDEVIAGNGTGSGRGLWGRTLEGNIPLGLGFNFRLNNNLLLNLESTLHGFNSDKLDAKVGGPKYDMFSYTSLGLTYKFIKKRKSPIIIKESVQNYEKEKTSPPKAEPKTSDIKEIPVEIISKDEIAEQKEKIVIPKKEIVKEQIKPKVATKKVVKKEKVVIPEIEYRVQILAKLNRSSSLSFITNKYNLKETIREDFHNGYYIYTIGSFKNYEATRRYRDKLRSKNKIYDAYIVVFKNGKRLNKLSELKK